MARRLGFSVLFVSASFVLILPVSVRNYVTLGDRVLVTADAGKVFFHGNGPGATALEWTYLDDGVVQEATGEPDYEHNLFRETAERITGRTLLPSEASKFWFKRTLDHIIENPSAHLWLVAQKLIFFFTDYELHYIGAAYADYKSTGHWPFFRYGWIAGFGLVGILLSAGDWRKRMPIYGAFFVYLATCIIFIVQSRYRTPATPYLCLFAAYAIAVIFQRFYDRKVVTAAMLCLAASGLTVFSFTAFSEQIDRIDRHQTAVHIHYLMEARPLFEKKNFKKAVAALDQSISLQPDYAPSRLLRGKIYALYKQYDAAESDFLKIIDMMPDSAVGYKNLGMLYLLEGQKEEALKMLQTANRLESSDETVLNALKRLKGERSEPVVWEIR
jgi:tetratricopeptide (TPR) repeat protein